MFCTESMIICSSETTSLSGYKCGYSNGSLPDLFYSHSKPFGSSHQRRANNRHCYQYRIPYTSQLSHNRFHKVFLPPWTPTRNSLHPLTLNTMLFWSTASWILPSHLLTLHHPLSAVSWLRVNLATFPSGSWSTSMTEDTIRTATKFSIKKSREYHVSKFGSAMCTHSTRKGF